jgi:hypothetical protein
MRDSSLSESLGVHELEDCHSNDAQIKSCTLQAQLFSNVTHVTFGKKAKLKEIQETLSNSIDL